MFYLSVEGTQLFFLQIRDSDLFSRDVLFPDIDNGHVLKKLRVKIKIQCI